VKIQRSLRDLFTGVVVDSRASIHAQHQCEIEIVSGVHHIEHNVEQKKGAHCLFSAMASGNACMLSWSHHQIATWLQEQKIPDPDRHQPEWCKKWAERQVRLANLKEVGFTTIASRVGGVYAAVQLLDFKNVAQHTYTDTCPYTCVFIHIYLCMYIHDTQ